MRKFFTVIAVTSFLITSCSDKTGTTTAAQQDSTDTTKLEYAYAIEYPDTWQTGSRLNTQMVLKGLKAFENGNMEESVKDFADTVKMEFDNFEAKMSKDSILSMFKAQRSGYKNFKIVMEDFESVKSKERGLQFVSLWYKQLWQNDKGKPDSLECMDDLEIRNGKIVLLNEKVRHYAAKKM